MLHLDAVNGGGQRVRCPFRRAVRQCHQQAGAVLADAFRVTAELRHSRQLPAAFGFDDQQSGRGNQFEIGASEFVAGLHSHKSVRSGREPGGSEQRGHQLGAARQRVAERRSQIVLVLAEQVDTVRTGLPIAPVITVSTAEAAAGAMC